MKNNNLLINKLNQFIRKFYINQLVRGGILTLLVLLLFFIFIATLEFYMNFDVDLRTFLFWLYIITNGLIVFKFIIIPSLKLFRLRKGISYKQAAKILGNHFNDIDDKLINILELSEMNCDNELVRASIEQKTKSISPIPFKNAVNLTSSLKKAKWLLLPFTLIFVFFITGKADILTKSSTRIIMHNKFFEPEAPFNIKIENELRTKQLEDFTLKIKIEGEEIPKECYIAFGGRKFIMQKKSSTEYQYLFKNLYENKKFTIHGGGYTSKEFIIKVIPTPSIRDVKTNIIYPKYTLIKNTTVNSLGDLKVPAGSYVEWIINFENTDSVILNLNNKKYLSSVETLYQYKKQYLTQTNAKIINYNNHHLSDTTELKIDIIKDLNPIIYVKQDLDSVNSSSFLNAEIRDDYGFKKLVFHYEIFNEKEKKGGNKEIIEISNNTNQFLYHEFNIKNLLLKEGDEVKYFFEIWDNDEIKGSKKTKSQIFIFKENTKAENILEKDKLNEKIKNTLSNSITKAQELKEELKEFNKTIIAKKELGWDDKQKLKEILKKQKKILEELKKNKNSSALNQKNQSKIKPSILEKQKKLKDLMDSVVDKEMEKLIEELEKQLNKNEKEKLKELLKKIDSKNNNLEKELDRELELFKQLDFEQKTEELIEEIKALKLKQEELKKETETSDLDTKNLVTKQDMLKKKMDELKKSINELNKKNEDLENKNSMPKTDQIEKDISNSMEQSKQSLEKKNKKKSSKSQKETIKKLDQLEKELSAMLESNSEEAQIENIETLREILENLINLSFSQETLIDKTQKTKTTSSEFIKLVQSQKKLSLDSKIIEDSLFALSKRSVKIQAKINSEISLIKENMKEASKNLENRKVNKSAEKQQFVMTSTNNLALLLSEILKNMQMDLSTMPSKCSKPKNCNKPKNCKNPSMSELKKAQKELNKSMKKGMNKDGKNKKSSQKLMELAKKQGLIKSGLESLEKENGKSNDSKIINKLKEQMEQNEYDIINNNISNKTLDRLDQIINKFLDFEKAEKEQGEDEKRESNEWILENDRKTSKYNKVLKNRKYQLEMLNTTPVNLTPYYKKEVNKYFNSIIKEKND
mgnify:CR=1 FL=1